MPIPDYQTLMLPLLKYCSDQQEHKLKDAEQAMAQEFNLTQQERDEMLPSGKMRTMYNRVGWSKWHLQKAGVVSVPRTSVFKITQRGLELLAENPPVINSLLLKRYEEYREFIKPSKTKETGPVIEELVPQGATPRETLEAAYEILQKQLVQEVLDKVKESTPRYFEEIVVELLVKMGYGGAVRDAGSATQFTNDEGIDGIIKEDKLGLDVIYIQAKKWTDTPVGRPDIQAFVGALDGKHANKGIFITTSRFSEAAVTYARNISKKVVLIDGEQLANYMIEYNLGVNTTDTFLLKRVDNDYFGEQE